MILNMKPPGGKNPSEGLAPEFILATAAMTCSLEEFKAVDKALQDCIIRREHPEYFELKTKIMESLKPKPSDQVMFKQEIGTNINTVEGGGIGVRQESRTDEPDSQAKNNPNNKKHKHKNKKKKNERKH